jgi:hypothetical protein
MRDPLVVVLRVVVHGYLLHSNVVIMRSSEMRPPFQVIADFTSASASVRHFQVL